MSRWKVRQVRWDLLYNFRESRFPRILMGSQILIVACWEEYHAVQESGRTQLTSKVFGTLSID